MKDALSSGLARIGRTVAARADIAVHELACAIGVGVGPWKILDAVAAFLVAVRVADILHRSFGDTGIGGLRHRAGR